MAMTCWLTTPWMVWTAHQNCPRQGRLLLPCPKWQKLDISQVAAHQHTWVHAHHWSFSVCNMCPKGSALIGICKAAKGTQLFCSSLDILLLHAAAHVKNRIDKSATCSLMAPLASSGLMPAPQMSHCLCRWGVTG